VGANPETDGEQHPTRDEQQVVHTEALQFLESVLDSVEP